GAAAGRCRRFRGPRAGAGQPWQRQRRAAAGAGAARGRDGAGAVRRGAGAGAGHRRRTLVSRTLPTPLRAALLMLGSTALFALMVVAIRLASTSLHTFQVAFFRNFFG